jgi:hypothetical protein
MKTSSAKKKGRRCAANSKKLIRQFFPEIPDDDIEITSSGVTGRDLKLSTLAQAVLFRAAVECKNVEKLNIRDAYTQATSHARDGEVAIVFHTRNRDLMLVTMAAEDFLRLLSERSHNASREGTGSA